MNNDELKKKIADIIYHTGCTGACCECDYSKHSDADTYCKAMLKASALIEAGIGDVKEAECRARAAELVAKTAAETGILKYEEMKHRAEVAERALEKATELAYEYRTEADTLSCSSCPMFEEIFPKCSERGLYVDCSKRWKEEIMQQAEKELLEEGKDE